MAKVERDWSKTGVIVSLADWIRRDGSLPDNQVLAVIVMREKDGALSVCEQVAARDVEAMMCAHLAPLLEDLKKAREEKRKQGARVKWEDVGR
jgi:hypothetical protein